MKTTSTTEAEMRNEVAPWPKTIEELSEYIESLTSMKHDYGTCVYAMSLSAAATFNYVSSKEGCTGFQASCAAMDFIRRSRHIKGPFMLVDVSDELYEDGRTLGKVKDYLAKSQTWLGMEATKNLRETHQMCERVFARMLQLASRVTPEEACRIDSDFVAATPDEINLWRDKLEFVRLVESQGFCPSMEFVEQHITEYKRFGHQSVWVTPSDIALFDSCESGGMFRCGKLVGLQFSRDLDGVKVVWSYDCEEDRSNGLSELRIKVAELEALAADAKPNVAKAIREYLLDVTTVAP